MSIQAIGLSAQNADLKSNKINDTQESEELLFDNITKETDEKSTVEALEETQNDKVSFKEGLSLVGSGFVNKVKSMGKAIVEHPIRTVAMVGVTTGLLAAAPIVGISTATAGAFLAIGFGAFAIGKTVFDVAETLKDNKEGRYNEVRQDLQEIGGDGVDLALTLPFMPKAINQVSRFAKYGTSTVGLNTELLANLKNSSNLSEVQINLAKANTTINYEMIANEMGLAAKPELVFTKMNYKFGGFYEPAEGKMYINENQLKPRTVQIYEQMKGAADANIAPTINPEEILRHELQHYQQFSDIANVYGEDVLKSAVADYYSEAVKQYGASTTTPDADIAAIEKPVVTEADIKRESYMGTVPDEAEGFNKAFNELIDKLNEFYEKYQCTTDEYKGRYESYLELKEIAIENKHEYLKAVDELAKDTSIPSSVIKNMTNGDMSTFNSELYQQAANSNATAYTASDVQRVDSYLQGLIEKVHPNEETTKAILEKYDITSMFDNILYPVKYNKAQYEIYVSNPLESEAYAAQKTFASQNLLLRPSTANNVLSQTALTEEKINSYTGDKSIVEAYEDLKSNSKIFQTKSLIKNAILNPFLSDFIQD